MRYRNGFLERGGWTVGHDYLMGGPYAGKSRRLPTAESAISMWLSLVAVGQGLVVNPNWLADARSGREGDIHLCVSAGDVIPASIPRKLWAVIDATPGWFNVTEVPGS